MTDCIDKYTPLEQRLLNDFQRDLPLSATPFADIAQQTGVSEQVVLESLESLQRRGVISRIGPVFQPNMIGASTLAAMAVAPEKLLSVAQIVSGFDEVNHNYEREHDFNLWFVVTASSEAHVDEVLTEIERQCEYPVLALPMLQDYFIDLGFLMKQA